MMKGGETMGMMDDWDDYYDEPDNVPDDICYNHDRISKSKKHYTSVEELEKQAGMTSDKYNEGGIRMKYELGAPKYNPGDVIDISYRHGGMPNRIRIENVVSENAKGGWTYTVTLESTGGVTSMTESFISERICHKSALVYSISAIQTRYASGWRWCGNFVPDVARTEADKIAKSKNVAHVRITESYRPDGRFMNNRLAVWLQYKNPIAGDGDNIVGGDKFVTIDVK